MGDRLFFRPSPRRGGQGGAAPPTHRRGHMRPRRSLRPILAPARRGPSMIRVAICGTGTMGSLVLSMIEAQPDMEPVGMVEPMESLVVTEMLGRTGTAYPVHKDPGALFEAQHP